MRFSPSKNRPDAHVAISTPSSTGNTNPINANAINASIAQGQRGWAQREKRRSDAENRAQDASLYAAGVRWGGSQR